MRRNVILFLILSIGLIQAALGQETVSGPNDIKAYLLTPGDEIIVRVLGEKDFDFEAIVDENGNIDVPYFDTQLKAMCKTERELKLEVVKMLGKYLKTPQVSVKTKDRNQNRPTVSIFGEVRSQQQVVLGRQFRLAELLARSGGQTENAGAVVMVTHTQLPMCASPEEIAEWRTATSEDGRPTRVYNLKDVNSGRDELNPIIYPGDIIEVPTAKPVYIVGEVKSPQGIYIKGDGLSLFEAINKLGGLERTAKSKEIKIYRLKSDVKDVTSISEKDREVIAVNYETIEKTQKGDILLHPYDIVIIDKRNKSFGEIALELAVGGARTVFTGVTGGIGNKVLY